MSAATNSTSGWTSVEHRALAAFRTAVLCMMTLLAFEWGTRLYTMTLALSPAGRPHLHRIAWALVAFAAAWFAAFGAIFWATTRHVAGDRPARRSLFLLGLQFFVGWGGSFELLVLVACQTPFLLSGRALAWCLAAQGLLPLALDAFTASASGFQLPADALPAGLRGWPPLVAWTVSELLVLGWKTFGATAGWMVARAVRSRRELVRANAELRASRELLSESARVAERLHVSRELHDALGHHLAALAQQLELARRRSKGEAADAVAGARTIVLQLLDRLRRAVAALRRPATLDLARALRTLAEASRDLDLAVAMPERLQLDPVRAELLFHCACQVVGAAALAGDRRRISVELTQEASGYALALVVSPPMGPPLGPEALRALGDRLGRVGASIHADLAEGGYRILIDLPVPGEPS